MTQEDQTHNCCNSSSGSGIVGIGGRSSKKPKQKKIPQRGLGVAQLEKIRVEEQQKKDAAIASPAILLSPSSVSSSKSFYLPLPITNFNHYNQPSSSPISFHSGSPLSLQDIDVKVSSTVLVPGHGSVPKLWSSNEYDFEKERFGVDPGLVFLSSLPFESTSNPNWPNPKRVQRTQQLQRPFSSSMVNVSSGTSSTHSLRYSMEPPSNQNYSGSCIPLQPEEKIIGMKRPYPFSLDVPPAPSFNFRLPTFAAPMKINETTSCGSGSGFNYAGNATFREVPSSSPSSSEPNSKRIIKENENFNGDFLSLAPPTPPSSCPPSNFKCRSTFLGFHNQEYPHLESLSRQGFIGDQITELPGFNGFTQEQQPLYSFFPPAAKAAQFGQTTTRIQNCDGEVGENVDLNLKL